MIEVIPRPSTNLGPRESPQANIRLAQIPSKRFEALRLCDQANSEHHLFARQLFTSAPAVKQACHTCLHIRVRYLSTRPRSSSDLLQRLEGPNNVAYVYDHVSLLSIHALLRLHPDLGFRLA